MTIETKFKPEDQVHVLDQNKIQIRRVRFIKITTRYNEEKNKTVSSNDLRSAMVREATPDYLSVITYIMYPLGDNKDLKEEFKEKECFFNKEALIKSL
jgi:hypothetical protein